MQLFQVFLPLFDETGQRFERDQYEAVQREFVARFKGFTAYTRAPVRGLWKDDHGAPQQDELIIYEVMCDEKDTFWWTDFRRSLETTFQQDKIVIRCQSIDLI